MFKTTAMVHLTNRRQALAALQTAQTRGVYTKMAILAAFSLGLISLIGTSTIENPSHRRLPGIVGGRWKISKLSKDYQIGDKAKTVNFGMFNLKQTRYLYIDDPKDTQKQTIMWARSAKSDTAENQINISDISKEEVFDVSERSVVFLAKSNKDKKKWYKFEFKDAQEFNSFRMITAHTALMSLLDEPLKSIFLSKPFDVNSVKSVVLRSIPGMSAEEAKHYLADDDALRKAVKIVEQFKIDLPESVGFICRTWYENKNLKAEEKTQKVQDEIILRFIDGLARGLMINKECKVQIKKIMQILTEAAANETTQASDRIDYGIKLHKNIYDAQDFKKLTEELQWLPGKVCREAVKAKVTVTDGGEIESDEKPTMKRCWCGEADVVIGKRCKICDQIA